MADNYLERQREAYEARKAAWEKAKKLSKLTKKKKQPVAQPAAGEKTTDEPEVAGTSETATTAETAKQEQ